jgi:hypothetical protein
LKNHLFLSNFLAIFLIALILAFLLYFDIFPLPLAWVFTIISFQIWMIIQKMMKNLHFISYYFFHLMAHSISFCLSHLIFIHSSLIKDYSMDNFRPIFLCYDLNMTFRLLTTMRNPFQSLMKKLSLINCHLYFRDNSLPKLLMLSKFILILMTN